MSIDRLPAQKSSASYETSTIDAMNLTQILSVIFASCSFSVVTTYAGARFRNWLRGTLANSLAGKQYVITTTLQDAIWEMPICKAIVIASAVLFTFSLGVYGVATAIKASAIREIDPGASFCDAFDWEYSPRGSGYESENVNDTLSQEVEDEEDNKW